MSLIRKYTTGVGWQTVLDSGGGEVTPPVDLQGTDPAESVLVLRADDAQTQHILRVYDYQGDLAVDIDFEGKLDTRQVVVQDPPDTGGAGGSSAASLIPNQLFIASGDDTSNAPVLIQKWDGNSYQSRFTINYTNEIVELHPLADEVAILMAAPSAPSGNAIEMWDFAFDNLLFAVTQTGGVIFPAADPHVVGAWWDNAGTLTRSSG